MPINLGDIDRQNQLKQQSFMNQADSLLKYNANVKPTASKSTTKKTTKKQQGDVDYFADGYQFGDVTKTAGQLVKNIVKTPDKVNIPLNIGATALDAGAGVVKGIATFGENIGDLAQYGVAQVADWVGADKAANAIRENAKFNSVDYLFNPIEKLTNKYSALGSTGDQLASGVGNVVAMANGGALLPKGARTVNVGKYAMPTTAIVSGAGSGITEAYNNGATNGQAAIYGALSGLVEGFSESLFGGLGERFNKITGGGALDDYLIKKFTDKITNKTLQTVADTGLRGIVRRN